MQRRHVRDLALVNDGEEVEVADPEVKVVIVADAGEDLDHRETGRRANGIKRRSARKNAKEKRKGYLQSRRIVLVVCLAVFNLWVY